MIIYVLKHLSPTCVRTLRAKNKTAKAFFAITGFVLVGNFSATFAFAGFWHYKPPDFSLGMYCRVTLRRRLLLLLVSSELILSVFASSCAMPNTLHTPVTQVASDKLRIRSHKIEWQVDLGSIELGDEV